MDQENKDVKNEKSLMDKIKNVAIVIGAVIGVVSGMLVVIQGVDAYLRSHRQPTITINNHLALPIVVMINDSSAYEYRVEANSQKTVTLLSESDFPAKLHWSVIRNKNGAGEAMGDALSGDYSKIDKERELDIVNTIGADTFFYPTIHNNSNMECLIYINDGLTTQYFIGMSNPGKVANITGYFKYAKNSNVTLYCNNEPYWHGVRNGVSSAENLPIEKQNGITDIFFP